MTHPRPAPAGHGTKSGRRAPLLAAVTVALAVLASACGIPVEEDVELIAADGHQELLEGTTTTTEPLPPSEGVPTRTVDLYFIGLDNKLEVVPRVFNAPVKGSVVLAALEAGPEPGEVEAYAELGVLTTLLREGLSGSFGGRNEETGVQRVDVDPIAELRLIDDEIRRLIVAQIVCTVLNLNQPTISGVEIYDGEEAIPLNDNNAEPIEGPARIDDFEGCKTGTDERAELASTSTTTTGG